MLTPKERVQDIRDRFYPQSERPGEVFFRRVLLHAGPDIDLLEVGCGRDARFLHRLSPHFRFLFGVDPEVPELTTVGNMRISPGCAEHLPFPDNSIPVVTSTHVVEHLEHPALALSELARVLTPGGTIHVLTPNRRHPPLVAGRIFNHRLRQRLNTWATGTMDVDTYPAFYRLNTMKNFIQLAATLGLNLVSLRYVSNHPQYLMFSRLCYRIAVAIERTCFQTKPLAFLRQFIMAELEKPLEPCSNKRTKSKAPPPDHPHLSEPHAFAQVPNFSELLS